MGKQDRMTSLGGEPPSSADRKFERYPFRRGALVVTLGPDLGPMATWWCELHDLSQGGACFVAADMPCERDLVIIALPPSAKLPARSWFAEIVHVGTIHGEWIRCGCRFVKAPPEVLPLLEAAKVEVTQRFGGESHAA